MAGAWVAACTLALLIAPAVHAFIPTASRTLKAIADVNRASGRSTALQLDLTMRIADRPPVASGELISHPTGLARLELRGYSGRVDRYLLSGSELLAAKDGRRLESPQPMLQPFFLLQPASATTLSAALETFGVKIEWIGLAPCGEADCFVIGDPRLAAPEPLPGSSETETEGMAGGNSEMPQAGEVLQGPELELSEGEVYARLWVDTRDLQVRRIDRASGVFMILGPMVQFDKLQLPAWFEIHEPGEETIRFDIDRAVQVNAPPKAFSRKWLLSPVGADGPEAEPPNAAADPSDASQRPGALQDTRRAR